MTLSVAAISLLAGALMGLTGIGGVLVVPALTELARVPVDRAVAASMMGFLIAGTLAAVSHVRSAALDRRRLAVVCVAAAMGAAIGSVSLGFLPATAVRLFIAGVALASGLNALLRRKVAPDGEIPSPRLLGPIGLAAGYGSAISGTGGPVLLIPMLLALRTPASAAIALGLAAGVPVIFTATAINALASRIDFALGAMLAVLLALGTLCGTAAYRRIPGRAATVTVAATLVATGIWYGLLTLR